jgi:hypothetical protein
VWRVWPVDRRQHGHGHLNGLRPVAAVTMHGGAGGKRGRVFDVRLASLGAVAGRAPGDRPNCGGGCMPPPAAAAAGRVTSDGGALDVDFTIGDPSGHRWLPAAACTCARAAEVHPCIVWSWLPKIRRVRPSRPAPLSAVAAIARACDERDRWNVKPASLWTASGPQSGSLAVCGPLAVHMLEVCPQALRASSRGTCDAAQHTCADTCAHAQAQQAAGRYPRNLRRLAGTCAGTPCCGIQLRFPLCRKEGDAE